MVDRRIGFQLGEFKIFDSALVQGDLSFGDQIRVKIARFRIDLRYEIGDVEIRRGKIEVQLGFFAVAPPTAGARREADQGRIDVLKVNARFIDLDLAVEFAKRLKQRMNHHLDIYQIQIADKVAPDLGIE